MTRESMIVFHASSHEFTHPSIEMIQKNITNHRNGLLGLWCAFKSDWIKGFGNNTYLLHLLGKTEEMSISEFSSKCHPKDQVFNTPEEVNHYFLNWRNELLKNGTDILMIKEIDGRCDMLVVINFDCIIKLQKRTTLH